MDGKDQLKLDKVVFYGRSLAEYELFFNLDRSSLRGLRILDCPAGTASFVAEATALGAEVVGVDPVYREGLAALEGIARRDIEHTLREVDRIKHVYRWDHFTDWKAMHRARFECLDLFLNHWKSTISQGRYVAAALPRLPFQDASFDIVLSAHLLFIYHDRFPADFQLASLTELARVATGEVRVFPVALMNRQPYPQIENLRRRLETLGIETELEKSRHEFVEGWNTILVLYPPQPRRMRH